MGTEGANLQFRSLGDTDWVRCRVLSTYGSDDQLFARAALQELQRGRPGWHHERLDEVAHVPQLEARERFSSPRCDRGCSFLDEAPAR